MSRYEKMDISNIKEIEFREDFQEPEDDNIIISGLELVSIHYDTEDKVYIVENDDDLIFNPEEIKITYKD